MKGKIDVSAAIVLIVAAAFLAFAATYVYMGGESVQKSKYDEAMAIIEQYYVGDYEQEAVEDYALMAMIDGLGDQWSYYMTAEELALYEQDVNNEYSGIGISIEASEGGIRIVEVMADSPAGRAGVRPGCELMSVEGEAVSGLEASAVGDMVRAALDERGEVSISVQDDGVTEYYTIPEGMVYDPPVKYELLGNIGYIEVESFDADSGSGIIEACDDLREQGAEGLVFDLRFNPGGLLDELLEVLDYLLPEGDLFLSKTKVGELERERSDADCLPMPMAVLVNEHSYSAAEFFAAALQEYNWATVVGWQTTGKGYAQITLPLSDGSAVHISAREYFTPNGVSLAGVGIAPDIAVELEYELMLELYYDSLEREQDTQLQAAFDAVKEKIAG